MGSKRNVLTVGGTGLLGRYLNSDSEVDFDNMRCSRYKLDIRSFRSIVDMIEESNLKPGDYILNCAAFTDVAKAEKCPTDAYAVNVEGVKNLATACAFYKLKLIHISTGYVYDGKLHESHCGYSHNTHGDCEIPLNVYGKSKLAGEKEIVSRMPKEDYLIIRTDSLYGENHAKKTILHKILQKILTKENDKVVLYEDQLCSFTYAKDLAKWIRAYIASDDSVKADIGYKYGQIVNVVNRSVVNGLMRHLPYFVETFLDYMGLEDFKQKIRCIPFPEDGICPDGVCRPKNVTLFSEVDEDEDLRKRLGFTMSDPRKALKDFCLNNYRDLVKNAQICVENNGQTPEQIDLH